LFIQKKPEISGRAATWILLLILVITIIIGFKFGTAYFNNATLKSKIEEVAERTILEQKYNPMKNVIMVAEDHGIFLEPEDIFIKLSSQNTQMKINFTYIEEIDLHLKKYHLEMYVDVTKDIAKQKNILRKFRRDLDKASHETKKQKRDTPESEF